MSFRSSGVIGLTVNVHLSLWVCKDRRWDWATVVKDCHRICCRILQGHVYVDLTKWSNYKKNLNFMVQFLLPCLFYTSTDQSIHLHSPYAARPLLTLWLPANGWSLHTARMFCISWDHMFPCSTVAGCLAARAARAYLQNYRWKGR